MEAGAGLGSFIAAYFASKHVHLITAFLCYQPEQLVSLSRAVAAVDAGAGLRLRVPSDVSQPQLHAYGTQREGMLLDLRCPNAEHVLLQASTTRAFNLRHSWLLLHNASVSSWSPTAALQHADILPDGDVTVALRDGAVDVYRAHVTRPWSVRALSATARSTRRHWAVVWAHLPSAVQRRKDLQRVTLRAETIVSQPQHFKGWTDLRNRQIDTFPKLTYPLMMLVGEDLNFRYNLRQTDTYGTERNGSFDGLVGRLQRSEVELGVSSMFMRADRMRALHFVAETVELRGAFLFLAPAQAAVSNVFVLPFTRGVWLATSVLFTAAFVLLVLLRRAAPADDVQLRQMTPGEAFTFAIGAVCQQGHPLTPALQSARLVMFCAVLLALFAFTAYSATVVAILQAPSDAVRSIADLARSSMPAAVQDTTYKKVYFAESNDPATQSLYRSKLQPKGDAAYLSVVDGIARVQKGFFAFQVEESAGYDVVSRSFSEREKCALRHVTAFKLPMVCVPIVRHSGYRDLLAARIRWQREVGVMGRWQRVWLAERARCEAGAGGVASVELTHVMPAVQLLCGGAALSLLVLLGELLVARVNSRRRAHADTDTHTTSRRRGAGGSGGNGRVRAGCCRRRQL